MRSRKLVPVALLLIACGGRSANQANGSPNEGGAAGTLSGEAAGNGGSGGSTAPGVGGAAGAVAAAGAFVSEAGSAGQPMQACTGLDCLAGAELVYVPDRKWQRPDGPASMTEELSEADYQPLLGPSWLARFSSDALSVELTPVAGGATVHGSRDPAREGRAWYELVLFAGGRFVVEASSGELHAEYTNYGSGMPIIGSTRGLLLAP